MEKRSRSVREERLRTGVNLLVGDLSCDKRGCFVLGLVRARLGLEAEWIV